MQFTGGCFVCPVGLEVAEFDNRGNGLLLWCSTEAAVYRTEYQSLHRFGALACRGSRGKRTGCQDDWIVEVAQSRTHGAAYRFAVRWRGCQPNLSVDKGTSATGIPPEAVVKDVTFDHSFAVYHAEFVKRNGTVGSGEAEPRLVSIDDGSIGTQPVNAT